MSIRMLRMLKYNTYRTTTYFSENGIRRIHMLVADTEGAKGAMSPLQANGGRRDELLMVIAFLILFASNNFVQYTRL